MQTGEEILVSLLPLAHEAEKLACMPTERIAGCSEMVPSLEKSEGPSVLLGLYLTFLLLFSSPRGSDSFFPSNAT